ncbi:MAG: hypothetical protein HY694_17755, partial [Deltaproteobacteria bacterium]|nr:hypothetical protein [Deltaproteobacteria bacterium]
VGFAYANSSKRKLMFKAYGNRYEEIIKGLRKPSPFPLPGRERIKGEG